MIHKNKDYICDKCKLEFNFLSRVFHSHEMEQWDKRLCDVCFSEFTTHYNEWCGIPPKEKKKFLGLF